MSIFQDKIELQIEEAELAAQKSIELLPPALKWFFIIGIIAIIPVYFISKVISQHIWQGRYEQNLLAAKPSFTNAKAPTISDITVTTLKAGSYAAALTISNPNFDLSLDQVPYQIIFYNAQKQQIYSYTDKLFLLPNQAKYLTVPTFTAQDLPASAALQLPNNPPWQKRLQIPTVDLVVSPPSSTQQSSPSAFVVTGDFTNQSPYILGSVRLAFVVYDTNNKIIAVSQRDEFTVGPFQRRSYTQLWPQAYVPALGKIDVQAYTDVLDPNNLSAPSTPSGSSSDLSHPAASQ